MRDASRRARPAPSPSHRCGRRRCRRRSTAGRTRRHRSRPRSMRHRGRRLRRENMPAPAVARALRDQIAPSSVPPGILTMRRRGRRTLSRSHSRRARDQEIARHAHAARPRRRGCWRQYRRRPGEPPAPGSPPPAPAASDLMRRRNRNRARSRSPQAWRHRLRPRPAPPPAAAANRRTRRRDRGRATQSRRWRRCRAAAARRAAAYRPRCNAALPPAAVPPAHRFHAVPAARRAPHRAASAKPAGAGARSWPGYALNRAGNKQNRIPAASAPSFRPH